MGIAGADSGSTMAVLQIPFTIDLELVQRTDSLLRGQRLCRLSLRYAGGRLRRCHSRRTSRRWR